MANAPRPAIFCYQLPFMEYGWGPEVKEVSRLHQSALSTGAAYSRPIIFDDRYQYLPGEDMRAALFAEDFYILDDDNFKAGMAEKLFDRLLQKARAMLASELQRFDEGSITLSNSPQQTAVSRPSCADRAAGQAQPAEPPTTPSPSAFARSTDTFILRGGSVYGAVEQGQDRPRSPAFGLY